MLPVDISHPPAIDLERLKVNQVRKAMSDLPEYIKRMSVAECRAESARLAAEMSTPGLRGREWAYKLLSRLADGERLPLIAERFAREATKRDQDGI